ncbi:CoA-binding protein [Pontibacillus yanchengensis]|uniref:CoA-binding protein n=2 Tax=Pontibacillus yanchengensis TaxID=462910 RepID=A0ACC7VCF5_9BACI|nr:CoA-binding protein [Pontibacillus yanchengensis]MYL33290.1 CoA-binding protein [Pontibacillus yanchengensis]MYL51874.1 CoA-binding protein [Pontibacillus yanchengensis]
MAFKNPSNDRIKDILETSKTIAVVGLSDNPSRTSYQISKEMQNSGYNIIPVNPTIEESLGVKAVDSLKDINEPIDIINVFRRSEYLPDIAREAVQTDAKVFWAQQGVVSEEAADYLQEYDVTVLMDTCIKVAHSVTIGK